MIEYVDEAFDGPPLKPSPPEEALAHALVDRFFDANFAVAVDDRWSIFVGPPRGSVHPRSCARRSIVSR